MFYYIYFISLFIINRCLSQLIISVTISASNEVRKLTLMYLANDVIQNSRRKGPEFGKEFSLVLKKAFTIIGNAKLCTNTVKKLQRLLYVWEERNIYDISAIEEFKACLFGKGEHFN